MEKIEVAGLPIPVSRIGLGCGRLVGGASSRNSSALVDTARQLGISHFDVAPSYGLGLAEALLGQVLGDDRNATIATKVGIGPPPAGQALAAARWLTGPFARRLGGLRRAVLPHLGSATPRGRFAVADVQTSLDRSFRALRRSSVDMLLLHEPGPGDIGAELIAYLQALRQNGLTGLWGLGVDVAAPLYFPGAQIFQHRWTGKHADQVGALDIAHGVLREPLRLLVDAHPRLATRRDLSERLGFDLADQEGYPSLLLTGALALNSRSVVLVSSSDRRRLRQAISGIDWTAAGNGAPSFLAAFRDLLEDLSGGEAAPAAPIAGTH